MILFAYVHCNIIKLSAHGPFHRKRVLYGQLTPIRPRDISWQDWKYIHRLRFSSVKVKTFDVTVQWAETNLLQTSSETLN